jgi:hypothetical protein
MNRYPYVLASATYVSMRMILGILIAVVAISSAAAATVKAQGSIDGPWNFNMVYCEDPPNCTQHATIYGTMTFDNGNYQVSVAYTGDSQQGTYTFDGKTLSVCAQGGTGIFANAIGACTSYSVMGGDGVYSLDLLSTNNHFYIHLSK